MRLRTFLMAWIVTLLAARGVSADVGVFPVRGTNLSEGESAAIGNLIASAYAYRTGKPVLGPDQLGPVLAQTGSERDAAQQLGLAEYISVDAVRLTSRISLLVSLHNRYGSELYRLRTTATSLDDMEVVSERMAAAIERRTDMDYTRGIDSVTGKEARGRNRLFMEKIFGVRMAAILPMAYHLHPQAAVSIMFDGRLETNDYFLEFGGGLMLPSELGGPNAGIGGLLAQLGASYYLTHTSVSPYVGAGVSPRVVFGSYDGVGFAANAQLGLMFMRASSTRLYVELRVDQNLFALRQDYAYYSSASESTVHARKSVLPTELSVAAGIGW
jgi:hypothetical protein